MNWLADASVFALAFFGISPELIDAIDQSSASDKFVESVPVWLRATLFVLVVVTWIASKFGVTSFVKNWLHTKLRKKH